MYNMNLFGQIPQSNYDFVLPQNGSLYVELVDNMSQYHHALYNPLPASGVDLGYANMSAPQQFYGNMNAPQQFYGNMNAPQQPYENPRVSFGTMRFGPSYTIIGPHPPEIPPGAGIYDPNLVVPGAPSFHIGIY
ncbi:hypothetical protein I4U23_001485 [Adineta vaga]|nr:hypothetical protein I4U23_001485 [Adineta vaga]